MNPAEQINQSLSMSDVANRYGIEVNGAGFTSCPFHSGDKTPSLKIYREPGRGFYCYGCNTGGDVIRFVQLLFGLTFPQAVQRLRSDFMLIGHSDRQEDYEWQRQKRREKLDRENAEREMIRQASEHCQAILAMKTAEPMSEEWAIAAHRETYYGYLMEAHLYG